MIFSNSAGILGQTFGWGGGFASIALGGQLRFNVFACNQAGDGGGGAIAGGLAVENNTMASNSPDAKAEGAFFFRWNNITGNDAPFNFACGASGIGSCNNFFGNAVEDSACFGPGTSNISVDPLYGAEGCGERYCLQAGSPLLPENSPPGCGLIGAVGLCSTISVEDLDAPTSPHFASSPLHAYPNPFNPSTTIAFRLDRDSLIELEIIDVRGRVVAVLARGFIRSGRHTLAWEGRDLSGREVASGAYVAVLRAHGARYAQKLVLLR